MSDPDDSVSSGALPGLTNVPASTLPPSISTQVPAPRQPAVTTLPPVTKMAPNPNTTTSGTATAPDYAKIHSALGSNSLVRSTVATLPKFTGNENYINWSDQTLLTFKYCGIEKILTGKWAKPLVVANDADSE